MTASVLNTIGLSLDIVGVVGLFLFGLPPKVSDQGFTLRIAPPEPREVAKKKRYGIYSWSSLVLIVVGFSLQIAANWT